MAAKRERWQQRFENFDKAYLRFAAAVSWGVDNATDAASNSIVNAAGGDKNVLQELTVKRFELAFELAWLVLRDFLIISGFRQDQIRGPKYVIRKSFQEGTIRDGEVWMKALDSRNKAVHIYREEIMKEVFEFAHEKFFPVLRDMHSYFKQEYDKCDSD